MTLTPWRVAYSDSAAGANTIGDLAWRRVQAFAVRESATITGEPWGMLITPAEPPR